MKTSEGWHAMYSRLAKDDVAEYRFRRRKIRIQIATCIDYIFSRSSCTLPSEENACIDYRYIEKYLYTISFRGKTHTRTTDSHSEREGVVYNTCTELCLRSQLWLAYFALQKTSCRDKCPPWQPRRFERRSRIRRTSSWWRYASKHPWRR